ncbi:hypothetical protein QFZ58_000053 [Streptomyces sp. B1I3]|nr:hypothetical protein [Streptomyces sp. B1I3]
MLTPTGAWCEHAWLTTAMVSRHTERLKFLVAFRPGFVSPTLAAQMASTFQRQTGGRLLLNVVTGGESREQRAYGDFLDKDARYARTDEFLERDGRKTRFTAHGAPCWKPPAAGPLPLVAVNAPCVIRRRALTELAVRGTPATVVAEAAYLAGLLDAARSGLGAALLAVPGGQYPDGLTPRRDLPAVSPVRLGALARRAPLPP